MVGVAPANEKLRERARRNVMLASDARVALVSLLAGVDAQDARSRLEASEGSVRELGDQ